MSKRYLTESFVVDTTDKAMIEKRLDLMEQSNGKLIFEGKEIKVLGIYRTAISRPGKKNKNGRIYEESTWLDPLSRNEGEGSIGLLDHPLPGEAPSIKDAFCVWRNHKIERFNGEPLVKADMYILDNDNGKLIESIIEAGGRAELSTRGYGELDKEGRVTGFSYKSCDAVYEGSYSVNVGKDEQMVTQPAEAAFSEKQESVKIVEKSKEENTNNQRFSSPKEGDINMFNKILIRKAINEAFGQSNKFSAFNELKAIQEELKKESGVEDLVKMVEDKINLLDNALTEAYDVAEATDEEGTPSSEQQGDPNDQGTAPADIDPDASRGDNKIQDKDTAIPSDVHPLEVDPDLDDTTDAERADGKARTYQPGASKKSMEYEVMSGEVSHEAFEIPADMPIYEDEKGTFIVSEGNKMYVDILEDSNEAIPDDVHQIDVDGDVEDTEDAEREGYTDVVPAQGEEADVPSTSEKTEGVKEDGKKNRAAKIATSAGISGALYGAGKALGSKYAQKRITNTSKLHKVLASSKGLKTAGKVGAVGTGLVAAGYGIKKGVQALKKKGEKKESVNLYKLGKEQLIDTVLAMDEAVKNLQGKVAHESACYNKLAEYTVGLETYALKAERVCESEKAEKDQARKDVVESVEYVKQLQEKISSLENTLMESSSYIEKLEEKVYEVDQKSEVLSQVAPFVENLIIANPKLRPYSKDLMKCESIVEVRETANRLKSNAGKVRLGAPLTEGIYTQELEEGSSFHASMLKRRGMI